MEEALRNVMQEAVWQVTESSYSLMKDGFSLIERQLKDMRELYGVFVKFSEEELRKTGERLLAVEERQKTIEKQLNALLDIMEGRRVGTDKMQLELDERQEMTGISSAVDPAVPSCVVPSNHSTGPSTVDASLLPTAPSPMLSDDAVVIVPSPLSVDPTLSTFHIDPTISTTVEANIPTTADLVVPSTTCPNVSSSVGLPITSRLLSVTSPTFSDDATVIAPSPHSISPSLSATLPTLSSAQRTILGLLLHAAANEGRLNDVKRLIREGADVNYSSFFGMTPLHEAVKHDHVDVISLLLSNGADVHNKTRRGLTPLHSSCMCNNVQIVRILLRAGADPNCIDLYHNSPFHYAASRGCEDVIRLLMKAGANKMLKNVDNETPIDKAENMTIRAIICYDI